MREGSPQYGFLVGPYGENVGYEMVKASSKVGWRMW